MIMNYKNWLKSRQFSIMKVWSHAVNPTILNDTLKKAHFYVNMNEKL